MQQEARASRSRVVVETRVVRTIHTNRRQPSSDILCSNANRVNRQGHQFSNQMEAQVIERVTIKNLNSFINVDQELFPDINVVTGRNGAGKTTVLKILWYIISGNIHRIFPEMTFDLVRIVFSGQFYEIRCDPKGDDTLVSVSTSLEQLPQIDRIPKSRLIESRGTLDKHNLRIVQTARASVFFPTFRRIEGGFSIERDGAVIHRSTAKDVNWYALGNSAMGSALSSAMTTLSNQMSNEKHLFVSSTSTSDIISLLQERYTNLSAQTNNMHRTLARNVLERIRDRSVADATSAEAVLQKIEQDVDRINQSRDRLLKPFSTLSTLVSKIFQSKGIRLSKELSLGEQAKAIESDRLSAGEKQMLSFLCYNAFLSNTPFFIDEPEISLHVDWQRELFKILLEQESKNQFIIATHSPFIYSKYSDREVRLVSERGDENGN